MTDFYQSPADKLRFEILLKSLREGRLNLAILGDDEVALAHYGRRIFQHLREQGEEHVELWTSADSDKLVDRFNVILSELTLDQALDKGNPTIPKRYMIFPDTQGIQDFELQLLARLVNGFPASNINLILLINNQSSYEKKLSTFGKNLLQWVLESEDPTPSKPQRIETLDEWPGAKTVPSSPSPFKPPPSQVDLPPAPLPPLDLIDATPVETGLGLPGDPVMGDEVPGSNMPTGEELAKSWEVKKTSGVGGKVAGMLLVALLVSLATYGVMYKEQVLQEVQNLQTYLAGPSKASTSTTAVSTATAPTPVPSKVGMSSSNTPAPLKPTDALSTDKGEALVTPPAEPPVKQAEIAKPVEPTPPAQTSKPAEPKPVETPKPAEPAKAAPKPVEKTTSSSPEKSAEKTGKAAVQADNPAWVAELKDDAWVMQHGAFDSLAEARTFQGTALGYKAGQVFYTQRKGSKPYYILITGPYAEKAQAEALMRQNPPLAKAWLRSAKSLKAQFQE